MATNQKRDDNRKYLDADLTQIKSVDNKGTFEGIVATNDVDRHGEVINIAGIDTSTYMKSNPIVLFGHDYWEAESIIGKALSLTKTKGGQLLSTFELFVDDNPKALLVSKLIKKGVCSLSIGFIPKDIEGDEYVKSEMVEYSVVPVPANGQAAITARSLGLTRKDMGAIKKAFADNKHLANMITITDNTVEVKDITDGTLVNNKITEVKGAISSDLPTADEDTAWDAGAAIKSVKEYASDSDGNIDFAKYRKAFFWVDPDNADKQGGYKLPFANVTDNKLEAVWNGVAAAMAALNGARGGVDIPDADRMAVYNQICKYYKKFDKDVPEMKAIEDVAQNKGAVADELAEDAACQEKWNNLDAVCDIWWAFVDVYYDPETSVDAFATLLREVVGLFNEVLAGTYVAPDDGDEDDGSADDVVEYTVSSALRKLDKEKAMKLMLAAVDNTTKGIADDGDVTALQNFVQDFTEAYKALGDVHASAQQLAATVAAGGTEDDREIEEDQSTGDNPNGMKPSNTVRASKTTTEKVGDIEKTETKQIEVGGMKLDITDVKADNLNQLAAALKAAAVELEEDAKKLASSTTDGVTSPTVRKRKLVLKNARKNVVTVDKMVELTLRQLNIN